MGAALGADPEEAKGNKWNVTAGLVKTFGRAKANGISPAELRFKEVMVSAICRKAALSVLKT